MITTKSGRSGVAVGVGVFVGVGVAVGVGVFVGVGVAVGVGVGVAVGVAVGVGVGVAVDVGVGVLVGVGVGVGTRTVVVSVTELFVSSNSRTTSNGSTVAELMTVVSTAVATEPVIVMIATAAGPVPKAPRSQSTEPPVGEPSWAQMPRVVETEAKAKVAGRSSMRRTESALSEPIFLTSTV